MRRSALALTVLLALAGCDSNQPIELCENSSLVVETDDVVEGTGAEARQTSIVVIDYVGTLEDGTEFDSGTNVQFNLGGNVISGFREGIAGMRVGGRRTITIPPYRAYGNPGRPPTIPECATLTFDVTLDDING